MECKAVANLIRSNRVLVIAHRGESSSAPENTLPAFGAAIDAGGDLVELDYQQSSDHVAVVIHDATLDRTTDAVKRWGGKDIAVASKTIAELASLDAGSWYVGDPRRGRTEQFDGLHLPTLQDALELICARSIALVERKSGDAEKLIGLLEQTGHGDQVVVQSFDWEFLSACNQLRPDIILGALGWNALEHHHLDCIRSAGASIVVWHAPSLSDKGVAAIHQSGMRAWAWTVDDAELASRLVGFGIDAIITNRPRQMRQWLRLPSSGATSDASP
jgi:glycerophosphoryl diester phosphodiesterase